MRRRHFVAALVPLTAGCSQLPIDDTPEETPTETPSGDTPTPGTEEQTETEEEPTEEPEEPTPAIEDIAFLYQWERLQGFDGRLTDEDTVRRGDRLLVLAQVSLPDGIDAASGTIEVRRNGQVVDDVTFSVDDTPMTLDPLRFDTQPLDAGTLEAVVRASGEASEGEAEERSTLNLRGIASGPSAEARRHLEDARLRIADGVELFLERASADSLVDVTAEATETDLEGVIGHTLDADESVRSARRVTGADVRSEAPRVEAEASLVRRLVRAQRRAFEAITRSRRAFDQLGNRTDGVSSAVNNYEESVNAVDARVFGSDDTMESAWETVQDGRPIVDYAPKIEAFGDDLDAFRTWRTLMRRTRDGLSTLREGERAMDNNRRERAQERADRAIETFDGVLEDLRAMDRFTDTRAHHVERVELLEDDARFLRRRATR